MKRVIKVIISFTIMLSSMSVFSWEQVNKESAKLENNSAPTFKVLLEKKYFALYELISTRFILENPHDKEIVIRNEILYDPLSMIGITLEMSDSEGKAVDPLYTTRGDYVVNNHLILAPHETIIVDYKLNYNILLAGEYRIKAGYSWRYAKSLDPFDQESLAYIKDIIFRVETPVNEDMEALNYVGDPELLLCLQDIDFVLPRKEIKMLERENPEDKMRIITDKRDDINQLRIEFLEKYPSSTYAKNVLYAHSQRLKRDKEYSAAIEYFNQYINLYPASWFADDALLSIAECNIELKQIDEAEKIVKKLLSMSTDARIQRKAMKIQEGFNKGHQSLNEIYSH